MSLQFVIIISFFFFQPSTVTFREKFYTHPPLLPGEQIVLQQDHVTCVDTFSDIAQGILHITTYRIIFAGTHAQHYEDQGEHDFNDAEPEEVARRGHHFQTRSRPASVSHTKLHGTRSGDERESKQNKRYVVKPKGRCCVLVGSVMRF